MVIRDIMRLAPSGDREDGSARSVPSRLVPADREDLPYKVEIWNHASAAVEQIVAVPAPASAREYPDRRITLRYKNSVVARWNGPKH